MGRLISPPKPSAPQQVVYVPAPAAAKPVATPVASADTPPPEPTDAEASVERAENLLRRNRSRLGTVLTGFRGVLDQNSLAAPRKTLLGE